MYGSEVDGGDKQVVSSERMIDDERSLEEQQRDDSDRSKQVNNSDGVSSVDRDSLQSVSVSNFGIKG